MGWESFDVVKFDLGHFLQGQTKIAKLKSASNSLIIDSRESPVEIWDVKPTGRISWGGNLLMWSDLTLGPSFKVNQWFTEFGELSFRWIQICINFERTDGVILSLHLGITPSLQHPDNSCIET